MRKIAEVARKELKTLGSRFHCFSMFSLYFSDQVTAIGSLKGPFFAVSDEDIVSINSHVRLHAPEKWQIYFCCS